MYIPQNSNDYWQQKMIEINIVNRLINILLDKKNFDQEFKLITKIAKFKGT